MKHNRKGFTLIEVLISIGLLGMIISAGFGVLNFGSTVQRKSISEFEIQSSIRLVADNTNRISRFSTAVFTVPQSSFREDNLTEGWSYVGVLNGSIALYEYKEKDGVVGHHKTVIAEPDPNIDYKIVFHQAEEDHQEKIVGYTIQAFFKDRPVELDENGDPIGHVNLYSQVEALNSIQVIHKGTNLDPAVALAFRGDIRDDAEIEVLRPIAQIAMVLDVSGSMNWRMDGYETYNPQLRRIWFLKQAASELIEKFAASEYPVDISLVPFSTHANNPKPFRRAQDEKEQLLSDISALSADGGTNTGDGLRRAYHNILEGRNNPAYEDRIVSDYIIVLVDGVTTFATRTGWTTSYPYRTDGLDIPYPYYSYSYYYSHIHGNGSTLDAQGTAYVDLIGSLIQNDGDIKVFVIGFSSRSSDLESVDDIVAATGAEPKFIAGDLDELSLAFGEIQKNILNELWYIDGPDF